MLSLACSSAHTHCGGLAACSTGFGGTKGFTRRCRTPVIFCGHGSSCGFYVFVLFLQDAYVEAGTVLHNFAHIFDLLSRLRQAVDHPYLLIHGSLMPLDGNTLLPTSSRKETSTDVCALCQDDVLHAVSFFCFLRVLVLSLPDNIPDACEAGGEQGTWAFFSPPSPTPGPFRNFRSSVYCYSARCSR